MKDVLNTISRELNQTLGLMEEMAMNERLVTKTPEYQTFRLYTIGEIYLMIRKLELIKCSITSIVDKCKAEINGTFYQQYLKQFEGTDCESEYTNDTIYRWILGNWDDYPIPHIGDDIKEAIGRYGAINSQLVEGLFHFFPGLKPLKADQFGVMKETNLTEIQIAETLKVGTIEISIDEFNERLQKVKEIAESKGNIGTIIQLLTL